MRVRIRQAADPPQLRRADERRRGFKGRCGSSGWVLFYERGVSRKNFSHAGGMKDSFDRQPPTCPSDRSTRLPSALTQVHSLARRPALAQALTVAPSVLTSVLSETEGSRLRLRLSLVIRG